MRRFTPAAIERNGLGAVSGTQHRVYEVCPHRESMRRVGVSQTDWLVVA